MEINTSRETYPTLQLFSTWVNVNGKKTETRISSSHKFDLQYPHDLHKCLLILKETASKLWNAL